MRLEIIYNTCKEDLALNNLLGLICLNTQPNSFYKSYIFNIYERKGNNLQGVDRP